VGRSTVQKERRRRRHGAPLPESPPPPATPPGQRREVPMPEIYHVVRRPNSGSTPGRSR
jgi:hypothetical protein